MFKGVLKELFPLTTFCLCDFFFLWDSTTLGRICMKLVIVMGITWIADIISWAHSIWFGSTHFLWIITDLINALQGVFIFIVIGCQPQVNIRFWICLSQSLQLRHSHIVSVVKHFIERMSCTHFLFTVMHRFRMRLSRCGDQRICSIVVVTGMTIVNPIQTHPKWHRLQITHSPHRIQSFRLKQPVKHHHHNVHTTVVTFLVNRAFCTLRTTKYHFRFFIFPLILFTHFILFSNCCLSV